MFTFIILTATNKIAFPLIRQLSIKFLNWVTRRIHHVATSFDLTLDLKIEPEYWFNIGLAMTWTLCGTSPTYQYLYSVQKHVAGSTWAWTVHAEWKEMLLSWVEIMCLYIRCNPRSTDEFGSLKTIKIFVQLVLLNCMLLISFHKICYVKIYSY